MDAGGQTGPIVNLGILAHVDAGKTTLTERLLHLGGALRSLGRVDAGTAHTDFLPIERRRGISVRSALTVLMQDGVKINLIDTPGHVDFISEVERSLRALSAAVLVVSAVEWVEAQTQLLFGALTSMGIPLFIFINKTDRVGADVPGAMEDIAARLTVKAHLIETAPRSAPDGFPFAPGARDALIERLCDADDLLTERYLTHGGDAIPDGELFSILCRQAEQGQVVPTLRGSALSGDNVAALLTLVALAAPRSKGDPAVALSGVVFRVEHDAQDGRAAYVRLYGGTLRNRDLVHNHTQGLDEKVFQIRTVHGARQSDAGILRAGDIGAVYGLSGARVGDVLGDPASVPEAVPLATPLLRVAVTPDTRAKFPALMTALNQLSAQDPGLNARFGHDHAVVSITGKIQLEVLDALLKEDYGLAVCFGPPAVIYRETPARICEGFEAYTMPKPCWAVLRFLIEPLPPGSGVEYVCAVSNEKIHYRYQGQIEQTLPEALAQGPLGWQVTDLRLTLIDGEDHPIHTHPLDFALATPLAVMDGLVRGGTTLLEPMVQMTISVPEAFAGRVLSDIVRMRGAYEAPETVRGLLGVRARVPVATSMDYPAQLSALTSGMAMLSTRFDGYQPCPLELGAVAEHLGVDPRQRDKYILWKRGAISK